jgi:hypothetical protein
VFLGVANGALRYFFSKIVPIIEPSLRDDFINKYQYNMAKVKQPYVEVKEVVIDTPSIGDVTNDLTIGGVIVAPVGPKLALVSGPDDFLSKYTVDGETIPRNADTTFVNAYFLSYSGPLVIQRSTNTSAIGGLLFAKGAASPTIVRKKDGQMLTRKTTVEVSLSFNSENENVQKNTAWSFAFGDIVFYHIDCDRNGLYANFVSFYECDTIMDIATGMEKIGNLHVFEKHLVKRSATMYDLTMTLWHTDAETVYDVLDVHADYEEKPVSNNLDIVTTNDSVKLIDADESDWLFALYGDVALGANEHEAHIPTVFGNGSFELSIDGEKYLCSLQPDAIDSNGSGIYIDYINTQDIGFSVDIYANDISAVPTSSSDRNYFGNSGLVLSECAANENMMAAWSELADQEIYSIAGLSTFGATSIPVVTRAQKVAESIKCVCPIDAPYTATTMSSVKRYFNDLVVEYGAVPKGIALGPFDKNIGLLGWRAYIAASTLYWQRVFANKANSAEFAGVFSFQNGRMNYTDPVKIFGKADREALLNLGKPVNWAAFNYERNVYFMNDNRTLQGDSTSIVSEECVARQVLKISRDVDKIMEQFIGEHNTTATQYRVEDAINFYFQWNIMNQRYKPDDYKVICADDTLNNDAVKNKNELKVIVKARFNRSIKYIEVVNQVYPIGVDFSTTI